jgi:hypothetical protein
VVANLHAIRCEKSTDLEGKNQSVNKYFLL